MHACLKIVTYYVFDHISNTIYHAFIAITGHYVMYNYVHVRPQYGATCTLSRCDDCCNICREFELYMAKFLDEDAIIHTHTWNLIIMTLLKIGSHF